jgi:hypothetical protein
LLVSKQKEQLDVLAMKFQESEQARINDKAETDKKLEVLLSHLQSSLEHISCVIYMLLWGTFGHVMFALNHVYFVWGTFGQVLLG